MHKGEIVRGHEFHWSVLESCSSLANAYSILEGDGQHEGFLKEGLLASYIHLHFGSVPSMASNFVDNCRRFRQKQFSKHKRYQNCTPE